MGIISRFFSFKNEENIPKKNLKLMLQYKKQGGMLNLLRGESIGGNAGYMTQNGKKYSCAAANFIFYQDSGEIIIFGNYQDYREILSRLIKKGRQIGSGTFRLLYLDFDTQIKTKHKYSFFKIVNVYLPKDCLNKARKNLQESADLYNEICKIN